MISVCDVAVGLETAKFALTEVKLGLIPANIGPYVIARMGAVKAAQVFMNGRVFKGAEAVGLNLLSRAVSDAALDEAVEAEIVPYLSCAPGAVREAKALLRALSTPVAGADVEMAIDALSRRWETEEARAGIGAFFDKRPAPWVAQP